MAVRRKKARPGPRAWAGFAIEMTRMGRIVATVLNRTARKVAARHLFCGPHPIAVITTAVPASRLAKINQLAALR
jgi:hypothetical protein